MEKRRLLKTLEFVFLFLFVFVLLLPVASAEDSASAKIEAPDQVEVGKEVDINTVFSPEDEVTTSAYLSIEFYVDNESEGTEESPVLPGSNVSFLFSHVFEETGVHDLKVVATIVLGGSEITTNASTSIEVTPETLDSVEINVNDPIHVGVNEVSNISTSIYLPDLEGNETINISASLVNNGEQIDSINKSFMDNSTEKITFSSVFEEKGNFTPSIYIEATVNNRTVKENTSFKLYVWKKAPERKNIRGLSFDLPEPLRSEVSLYRQSINQTLNRLEVNPNKSFILSNGSDVFLVLADEVREGFANVSGWAIPRNKSFRGVNTYLFVAEDTSFDLSTQSATIKEVLNESNKYSQELIKINSNRRQISIQLDTRHSDKKTSVTAGYVSEDPPEIEPLVKKAIMEGKNISHFPGQFKIKDRLSPGNQSVPVFSYEKNYWFNGETNTSAAVLYPGTEIYRLLTNSTTEEAHNLIPREENKPILYSLEKNLRYENVGAIQNIKANPLAYQNKIVGFVSNGFGGKISVQEVFNKNTSKTVPGDILFEEGVSWFYIKNSIEESTLETIGVSSNTQKEIYQPYAGVYELIGRVISLNKINNSLSGLGLLVYEKQKITDINPEEIEENLRNNFLNRTKEMNKVILSFTDERVSEVPTKETNKTKELSEIIVENPNELPKEISVKEPIEIKINSITKDQLININIIDSFLSKVNILTKNNSSNAKIKIQQINKDLLDVDTEPIGETYGAFELDLINFTENKNNLIEIEFSVSKEWLNNVEANEEDVTLQRYNETWNKLETTKIGETQTELIYQATTNDLSLFVAAAETKEEEKQAPEFIVEDLSVVPETNYPDETTVATAEITNIGGEGGNYQANLTINDEVTKTEIIHISPNETKTIGFNFKLTEIGEYTIKLGEKTTTLTIEPKEQQKEPNKPNIEILDIQLNQETVKPNQNITATVKLQNTGEIKGNYSLNISINNESIKQKITQVNANSTKEIKINISRENEGNYIININGVTKEFSVNKKDGTPGFTSLLAIAAIFAASLSLHRYKKRNK